MNEIRLKQTVKKNSLPLTILVLVFLFSFENIFSKVFRIQDDMIITWNKKMDGVAITSIVYDYSKGKNRFSYIMYCRIEASDDGVNYYKLLEFTIPDQNFTGHTKMVFMNKLDGACIEFAQKVMLPSAKLDWPEILKHKMVILMPKEKISVVGLVWFLDRAHKNVRYMRVSGLWRAEDEDFLQPFHNVVYDLNNPVFPVIKSNLITP